MSDPMATGRAQDIWLRVIVVICSAMSVGALLMHAVGWLPMSFTISAISLPALMITFVIAVWAGRAGKTQFLRRLWVGVAAGFLATVVYDLVRLVAAALAGFTFDPFRSMPQFGSLILEDVPTSAAAITAGWTYHLWNGLSFAVMYTLVAGGARFWWAVAWSMTLEIATIITYPRLFDIRATDVAFISISVAGHAAYGLALGILARNWLGPESDSTSVLHLGRPRLKVGLA